MLLLLLLLNFIEFVGIFYHKFPFCFSSILQQLPIGSVKNTFRLQPVELGVCLDFGLLTPSQQ